MSNKYEKYGAYHWDWYAGKHKKPRYVEHVNRLKKWIEESNVLDIGAGDGLIASVLGIKGIDKDPRAVELAREKGADVALGNAYNTGFGEGEFDSVLMADTLEQLEQPISALREARRIMKKHLYLAVPVKSSHREAGQYYQWSERELKDMVERAGFRLLGEIVVENRKMYGKFGKE